MTTGVLKKHRILRFLVVGVGNAIISFGLLNLCYYTLGQGKIMSSIISTSCALLFSFAMNRLFVFSDRSSPVYRQFVPFVIVTVSGSLLVLNAVYVLSLRLLEGREAGLINAIQGVSGVSVSASFIDINLSTLIGAIVAMFWNYNGYRLFVFKGKQDHGAQTQPDRAPETES